MDIEVYNQATELLKRISACREMLDVLESEKFTTSKARTAMGNFMQIFQEDMTIILMKLHSEAVEEFADLQCCSCDKEPEEKDEDEGTIERD